MRKRIKWNVLILCFVIVYAVAFAGSIFTSKNTNTEWYNSIRPSITPPNWVFPVVWNILFFLIALSFYFSLISAKTKKSKLKIKVVFGVNFFLNILWSFLYFGIKNPAFAFIELLLLESSIICMIFITWKVSRKASLLLIPYALWVGFAGILNYLSAF